MVIQHTEIILYCTDQLSATRFYEQLLGRPADLHVPGMTEFVLSASCKLGLMPGKNIATILGDKTPHPDEGRGIPRCELYLLVADAAAACVQALHAGALPVSPLQDRDWGDRAGYFADPDGHIIAFAEKTGTHGPQE